MEDVKFFHILLIPFIIRDFTQDIFHPDSRVYFCRLACGYQRVHDGSPVCGRVIAAEQIVLPSQGQRSYGIFYVVVIDFYSPIVYVSGKSGKKRVRIFDGFTHAAFRKHFKIGVL